MPSLLPQSQYKFLQDNNIIRFVPQDTQQLDFEFIQKKFMQPKYYQQVHIEMRRHCLKISSAALVNNCVWKNDQHRYHLFRKIFELTWQKQMDSYKQIYFGQLTFKQFEQNQYYCHQKAFQLIQADVLYLLLRTPISSVIKTDKIYDQYNCMHTPQKKRRIQVVKKWMLQNNCILKPKQKVQSNKRQITHKNIKQVKRSNYFVQNIKQKSEKKVNVQQIKLNQKDQISLQKVQPKQNRDIQPALNSVNRDEQKKQLQKNKVKQKKYIKRK